MRILFLMSYDCTPRRGDKSLHSCERYLCPWCTAHHGAPLSPRPTLDLKGGPFQSAEVRGEKTVEMGRRVC